MMQVRKTGRAPITARSWLALAGILGASAGAWLWYRRGEAALHHRTAQRLRPPAGRGEA